ncbi:carbohydrate kinase family protein [Jatrophihabitans sp.]|uniref:carbohydrate kinase family protein n=1 Tax=Jatrophihabitans sp. TaxID=1932789 RepID=UPI002EDCFA8D
MIRPIAPGGRVVCLGDIMLDISALLPGPLVHGSDTPAPIRFSHGGSAANTAAWLASLGVPCVFAGRVGADSFGRDAVAALRSHGVIPRVSTDPDAPTGVCLVLVGPDGERTMVPSAGANATLDPADLGPDLLTAADHLHLSGYALLTEGSREAALVALRSAGEAGASVSVDAASAGPIRVVGPERFLGWLPPGTLLLANADELAALTGTGDQDAGLAAVVARGVDVVLKRGGLGSVLATAAGLWRSAAEPVEVLDSTGAGDAFAAGLLAALRGGADPIRALAEGNRWGAVAVGRLGGRP